MKKYYIIPNTTVLSVESQPLLSGSGVNSANGIGYAGVDTEGTVEPGARRQRDVWGEEEEY